MKALFIELPAFLRYRSDYLDDDGFRGLQETMMQNPDAGDVLEGAGGLQQAALRRSAQRKRQARRPAGDLLLVGWRPAVLAVYFVRQERGS